MLGFGFVIAFDSPPLDFRSSWWLVPVAQALVATPFVIRIVTPALRSIDPRLREVAATLGAPPSRAWREVDLPLVSRAFAAAAGFAFAISLGEFGATVFVARAEQPTLPVAIFRFLGRPGEQNQGMAAALAVVLAAIAVGAALLAERAADGRAEVICMLTVRDAHVDLGGHPALAGVDLDVAPGTVVAVLGPSGSGKSTLLRAIAGLQPLDRGTIELDGASLDDVPPHRRGIGLMFQDDALFPHRDVAANVGFGLRMQSASREVIEARVTEMLALVGLAGKEHRSIGSLSGGERKRVALARATRPRTPGAPPRRAARRARSSAPRQARHRARRPVPDDRADDRLRDTRRGRGVRARRPGCRDARRARRSQIAAPEELWATPCDAWTARFIGLANVEERGSTAVVTRPEGVAFRRDPAGEAVVVSSLRDGPLVTLRARYDSGSEIVSAHAGSERPAPGDRVRIEIDSSAVTVIPTESQGRDGVATDPA